MPNTILQTLNSVAYGGLEEGFITCENKKNQESIRVMAYNVKNKMHPVYRDVLGITKIEENGMYFVKVYKKPMNEIWIRDKETGKLRPMESKPLNAELFIAAEHMRKAGVSADKIAEYTESNGEILPEVPVQTEEPVEYKKPDFTKLLVDPEKWSEVKVEEKNECKGNLEDSRWMEKKVEVRRKEKEEMMKAAKGE